MWDILATLIWDIFSGEAWRIYRNHKVTEQSQQVANTPTTNKEWKDAAEKGDL